jgi:hypothetical protein
MDEIEQLTERITEELAWLKARPDGAPNLRDFPLGGAGYAEAMEAYQAETERVRLEVEELAERRQELRRARQ